MKKLIALLSALTLVIGGVTMKGSSAPIKSEKNNKSKCGVNMTQQVISYLAVRGYSVYCIAQIPGTQNFKAYTRKCRVNYVTKVYVSGSYILGHEDVPI